MGFGRTSVRVARTARAPGFTAAVILTLGLGIGVNAAVFRSWTDCSWRPPDGVVEPSSVRRLYVDHSRPDRASGRLAFDSFSYPFFRAIGLAEDSSVHMAASTRPRFRGDRER